MDIDKILSSDDGAAEAAAFDRLLTARHSCRGFTPDPAPRAVVRRIVDMARKTPSSCNSQPWRIVVVGGAAIEAFRVALSDHVRVASPSPDFPDPEYRGAAQDRRRVCGYQLYEAVGVERSDREGRARQAAENFRFFGAPHVAIVTTETALGVSGAADCGAFVGNFMLAAQSLGLGSVAQGALAMYAGFIRSYLNIPDGQSVVCGISFGYEDVGHPANGFRTERASVDEIATFVD